MRIASVSALVLSAFSLAACSGASGGGSSTSASSLDLCGLSCPDGTSGGGSNGSGGGTGTGTGSTGGGNTANLATGDTTIALESSILVTPSKGTSLSKLASTTAEILAGTKPTTQKFTIYTNTSSNGSWPTPVTMNEYVPGTQAVDPYNVGVNANGGAGTNYREYRALSGQGANARDEELQVWAWDNSYATQYRNASGGGEATQQAWSFGGNKTALTEMPTGGSATYDGRFVATAKTANYLKPDGADIDPNGLWMVQGASTVNANFATAAVTGTLTPETWESYQTGISGYYTKVVGSAGTVTQPDYSFYNATVSLKGTITGNTYAGTADLNNQYVSGDNPMYGGFFGTGATETTGVFNVYGTDPAPVGGSAGINDDRRGFLTINGAFHGTCSPCAPTP